jgi:hypothetical protein
MLDVSIPMHKMFMLIVGDIIMSYDVHIMEWLRIFYHVNMCMNLGHFNVLKCNHGWWQININFMLLEIYNISPIQI